MLSQRFESCLQKPKYVTKKIYKMKQSLDIIKWAEPLPQP